MQYLDGLEPTTYQQVMVQNMKYTYLTRKCKHPNQHVNNATSIRCVQDSTLQDLGAGSTFLYLDYMVESDKIGLSVL